MKKLHKLVLSSFIGPFILTFFIALFVLLMQFLWKYIDDMVGKGLEWYVIAELMLYASASLVPMALPLAILLSSIMTFGNLGEYSELVALKSSGISLQRIMLPLIIAVFIISIGAFYFSNNVLPVANLKFGTLLYDIRQQRPAFHIKEGVFYNGIDDYSIKVGKKGSDGKMLFDIMIYDHTKHNGNTKVIVAKSGFMVMSDDEKYLILNLKDGNSYEEMKSRQENESTLPHLRMKFEEYEIRFDLSAFKLARTDESLFKDHYQMLNISQLKESIDSLYMRLADRQQEIVNSIYPLFHLKEDSLTLKFHPVALALNDGDLVKNFPKDLRSNIIQRSANLARNVKAITSYAESEYKSRQKFVRRHEVEWHRKFTLSIACFVLFFIGAPLGAIIRKGGLGMPMVISVLFFVFFYVISITGEKFAKEGFIGTGTGMWFAILVMLPIGIFLTKKATSDSSLFDVSIYLNAIILVLNRFAKAKMFRTSKFR